MKIKSTIIEKLENLSLTMVFYIENCAFKMKTKNIRLIISIYLMSLYLIIQSIYKLCISFDIFNAIYLIIGVIMLIYAIQQTFLISYRKHRELKSFGYKNISNFYKSR